MTWRVEYTDEFGEWWNTLSEAEQTDIAASVRLLEIRGPSLPYPYSSDVRGSEFGQMRELRIQHRGSPYRILYAFDPMRTAILLIGGNKTGDKRWYEKFVPLGRQAFRRTFKNLGNRGEREMSRPFGQLREKMSPEAQRKSEEKAREMLKEMLLRELGTDMQISILRRRIEEMGGSLEITAHFPEGDVRLSQLGC